MGIGVGIFLIAVGAVLAFAVEADVAGISLWAVGWILMVVGLLGVIIGAVLRGRGRDADVVEDRSVRRPAG